MMKWDNICIPKDFGGLGGLDTGLMNEALLGKWVWKILMAKEEDLCFNMLKRKYFRNKAFAQANGNNGSQF